MRFRHPQCSRTRPGVPAGAGPDEVARAVLSGCQRPADPGTTLDLDLGEGPEQGPDDPGAFTGQEPSRQLCRPATMASSSSTSPVAQFDRARLAIARCHARCRAHPGLARFNVTRPPMMSSIPMIFVVVSGSPKAHTPMKLIAAVPAPDQTA
jgi:hypothetical protein